MNPDTPGIEPQQHQQLVMHVTGHDRSFLYAHPDYALTPWQRRQLQQLEQRLAQGEPLAYVLQQQGFYHLLLKVTPEVLIPRPETELLVQQALQMLAHLPASQTTRVLDLGTGSGAVALALAQERPNCHVQGTDISVGALKIAEENLRLNPPAPGSRVEFRQSDWFQDVCGRFDLIVANPPYVAEDDPHLEMSVKRFEPLTAVVAAENGFQALRRIIQSTPEYLNRETGGLLLEHGWQQGKEVRLALANAGFQSIETLTDLAGHERVSLGFL